MTQRRVTATNQLSTVIDALQLGRKTGTLTVERGEGVTFEEGTIAFVNGQVVNAVLGDSQGRLAATKLFSWQACRFSFVNSLPGEIPASQGALPAPGGFDGMSGGEKRIPSGSLVRPGMQDRLSRRPYPSAYALESLDAILLILDRQGFTRMHRRLFLLIDGKRSAEELAMLIRRTPDEVLFLLSDLEQAGFIQF